MTYQKDDPLEFLRESLEEEDLGREVFRAIEKGGMVTAEAVMEIARSRGYAFSRDEFQKAVLADYERRFRSQGGRLSVAVGVDADAPESSCQKGCISWTYNNYHPGHPKLTSG